LGLPLDWLYCCRITSPKFGLKLEQFQMADSIISAKGSPQGFNRYAYVAGDPINNVDPTGQFRALVEVPADWPCLSTDEECGCDPFLWPFCTVGLGYPPSNPDNGGGGSPPPSDYCAGHLGNIKWPAAVVCDGVHSYFTSVQLFNILGSSPPATSISYGIQSSANVKVKPYASIPSQVIFEAWFTVSPTANHHLFNHGTIEWELTYKCNGKTYSVSTPLHTMPCLGTT
jgi:hypothetical protein